MFRKRMTSALALLSAVVLAVTTFYAPMTVKAEQQEPLTEYFFTDIENHWAKSELQNLANMNALEGYGNNLMGPNRTITRAEFVTMLDRVLAWDNKGVVNSFKDVAEHVWFATPVARAVELGIVKGYEDGEFKPNKAITRAEMATILVKATKESLKSEGEAIYFKDVSSKHWALEEIKVATQAGLIKGDGKGNFLPTKLASRAEAAVTLERMLWAQGEEASDKAKILERIKVYKEAADGLLVDSATFNEEEYFMMALGKELEVNSLLVPFFKELQAAEVKFGITHHNPRSYEVVFQSLSLAVVESNVDYEVTIDFPDGTQEKSVGKGKELYHLRKVNNEWKIYDSKEISN